MDKHLVLLPSIQNDESFRKKAQLQDISQQSHPSVTPISPFMTFVQSAHPVCFQGSAPAPTHDGSLGLKSSSFLTKIPSLDSENLVSTQAKDSDPKLGSNPSSALSFDHFLSHDQWLHIYDVKTRKNTCEEESFPCTLRHPMSQPQVPLTSREGRETGFESWHRVCHQMHVDLFWEFIFLRTVKLVMQRSHLLERMIIWMWETLKLTKQALLS